MRKMETRIDCVDPKERIRFTRGTHSKLGEILWQGLQFDVIKQGRFYEIALNWGNSKKTDGDLAHASKVWSSDQALFNRSENQIRGIINPGSSCPESHWHAIKIEIEDCEKGLDGDVFGVETANASALAGILWMPDFQPETFDDALDMSPRDHDGSFHSTS